MPLAHCHGVMNHHCVQVGVGFGGRQHAHYDRSYMQQGPGDDTYHSCVSWGFGWYSNASKHKAQKDPYLLALF